MFCTYCQLRAGGAHCIRRETSVYRGALHFPRTSLHILGGDVAMHFLSILHPHGDLPHAQRLAEGVYWQCDLQVRGTMSLSTPPDTTTPPTPATYPFPHPTYYSLSPPCAVSLPTPPRTTLSFPRTQTHSLPHVLDVVHKHTHSHFLYL